MSRIAALDWGTKRIGIAISDESQFLAQTPLPALLPDRKFDKRFRQVLSKYDVKKIILGLPKTSRGDLSASGKEAVRFGDGLAKKFDVSIELVDERFSSRAASEKLKDFKASKARKLGWVDNIAAMILLQEYLDKNHAKDKI